MVVVFVGWSESKRYYNNNVYFFPIQQYMIQTRYDTTIHNILIMLEKRSILHNILPTGNILK